MKEKFLKHAPALWIPMVFIAMTFYMDDAYFNLLGSKAYIFLLMSLIYVICSLLLERDKPIETLQHESQTKISRRINWLDWAVISFVLVAVFSTILSTYRLDAFTGNYGWAVGSLYLAVLGVIYYLVSRNMRWQRWMYWVILTSAVVVFLWAITDEFYLDIFGMHKGIEAKNAYNYLSSIGNNNWFAGYWAMIMPFFLFGLKKASLWRNIVLGFGLFITVFAGVNSRADSLFIAFAVILGLHLLRAVQSKESSRYAGIGWLITGTAIGVTKLIRGFCTMIELEGISQAFIEGPFWLVIMAIGLVLLFVPNMKFAKYIQLVILIACIAGACVLVAGQVKVFDASWGNGRGETWMVAVKAYLQGGFKDKILGIGPDCFGYAYDAITGSDWFRNAHNEYLQYLVTMGVLGVISYIGIYLASIKEMLQNKTCTQTALPLSYICFTAIMAYAAQAVVNNPQALNGAILFTLLAILRGVDYTKRDEVV